jgi:hypothetical protein
MRRKPFASFHLGAAPRAKGAIGLRMGVALLEAEAEAEGAH